MLDVYMHVMCELEAQMQQRIEQVTCRVCVCVCVHMLDVYMHVMCGLEAQMQQRIEQVTCRVCVCVCVCAYAKYLHSCNARIRDTDAAEHAYMHT